MKNQSTEFWEEKIRKLKSNPWLAIEDYIDDAINSLKEKLVVEKDYNTILNLQAEIKALKGIKGLPQKLLSIYTSNLEAVKQVSLQKGENNAGK